MKIQIITLFPEMFDKVLNSSMLWKAQEQNAVTFELIDLRQFGLGSRRTVDDTPYGGGDGMLLKPEPVVTAIEHALKTNPSAKVFLPTPRGKVFKQSWAKQLAAQTQNMIIVCPRYEGYDERIMAWVNEPYCVGNYVLTGGEIPAMVLVDAVVRLLPGVLGGADSAIYESFQDDDITIEYPQYTRPEVFRGFKVPDVLISGHHAQIQQWRSSQSKNDTQSKAH